MDSIVFAKNVYLVKKPALGSLQLNICCSYCSTGLSALGEESERGDRADAGLHPRSAQPKRCGRVTAATRRGVQ